MGNKKSKTLSSKKHPEVWLDRKCDEKSLKICTTKISNKKNPQNVFFMNKQHRGEKKD
jgi:hypothetical protein